MRQRCLTKSESAVHAARKSQSPNLVSPAREDTDAASANRAGAKSRRFGKRKIQIVLLFIGRLIGVLKSTKRPRLPTSTKIDLAFMPLLDGGNETTMPRFSLASVVTEKNAGSEMAIRSGLVGVIGMPKTGNMFSAFNTPERPGNSAATVGIATMISGISTVSSAESVHIAATRLAINSRLTTSSRGHAAARMTGKTCNLPASRVIAGSMLKTLWNSLGLLGGCYSRNDGEITWQL